MIYAYAKIENGQITEYPIYEGDLKVLVGYTENPSSPFEAPDGYVVVQDAPYPQVELEYNEKIADDLPQLIEGSWTRVWKVEPLSEKELQIKTQLESSRIRKERNNLLTSTDWTQLSDSPVDGSAWVGYRQALRDIPDQSTFPWNVEWPTPPV
jgi:hypothetical protein